MVIGVSIALLGAGLIWAAFNCIDSLQHNSEVMRKYTGRSEFSHVDLGFNLQQASMDVSQRKRTETEKNAVVERRPAPTHEPTGSEIDFTAGLKAIDERKYEDAVREFSVVLQKIPEESKHKQLWQVTDWTAQKLLYIAFAYQQRAYCQLQLKQYQLAVNDLSEAIKIRPAYVLNFENRAKAYRLIGDMTSAKADLVRASQLKEILE